MPYCDITEHVRLYYEDFGDGSPVVFTSAGNLTHRMWENQVAFLASARHRTITYDWRGTGASSKPRSGYTGEAAAADLCALVERLDAAPATLVAHGIGTHLAVLAATRRPELVRALVLVSSAPWFTGERDGSAGGVPTAFLEFLERSRGVAYPQACADLIGQWLFHRPPSSALVHALVAQALEWPLHVLEAYAASMRDLDHRERLARIACPTLLVHGRHDRKQRYEGAVYLQRHIAGAQLVTLDHSAHMGQIEEVDAFNEALAQFLRRV